MHISCCTVFVAVTITSWAPIVSAFLSVAKQATEIDRPSMLHGRGSKGGEWSVADDWNRLSSESPQNAVPDSRDIFNQDIAVLAAYRMEQEEEPEKEPLSNDDLFLKDTIDHILYPDDEDVSLSSTLNTDDSLSVTKRKQFEERMGDEIALLIRCNESPQEMLVQQGRALLPLSDEERDAPSQLVRVSEGEWVATPFFRNAVETMFYEHCTTTTTTTTAADAAASDANGEGDIFIMDAPAVGAWMTKSLGSESEPPVGPHDRRVVATISLHGTYGKGYLTLENFQDLYLKAVVGMSTMEPAVTVESAKWQKLRRRSKWIKGVWRDIRNHGILSPKEQDYARRLRNMKIDLSTDADATVQIDHDTILDECEIITEKVQVSQTTDREGKSSHEMVEVTKDKTTPIWLRDGDFVFIDEESCIGCMQCIAAAPSSFRMVDNGRARTFSQRKGLEVMAAVKSCPVDCMHFVSFDELKELETVRDHGDGRDDHRHFGHSPTLGYIGRTPLHVSRRESDANKRSSWYHYLKNKCQSSSQCPQRGCYECPRYSHSGENPYFQQRLRQANHIRAQHFIDAGLADAYRKTADL